MRNPFLDNIQPLMIKNSNEFLSLVNEKNIVWIVSDRTSGKTTSIKNILKENKKDFFYFNCSFYHDVESFLKNLLIQFANTYIIKKDLSELANIVSALKDSFDEVKIKLNIDNDNATIKIESVEFKNSIEVAFKEIFDQITKISKENNVTLVLDEFDSLSLIENKKKKELEHLKTVLNNKTSFVMIGSNRDFMQSFFTSEIVQKMKTKVFQLENILETHWRMYLMEVFKKSLNKNIPQEVLNFILDASQLNPHYIRSLSSIAFEYMAREEEVSPEIILNSQFLSNRKFYNEVLDSLSLNQKKALMLIAHTEGVNVYKSENLKKIGLSKSSMERCITSFLSQKIINKNGMSIRIKDPLFEVWIKKYFLL